MKIISQEFSIKPEPKIFHPIDGNSLMSKEYEPLQFSIKKIFVRSFTTCL